MIAVLLWLWANAAVVTRADHLAERVRCLGDVRPDIVERSVDAALEAETPDVSAELLLAIAWGESRLEPAVKTGRACGPLQVVPETMGWSRARCRLWAADLPMAYRDAVVEIRALYADNRVHGDVARMLLYRACGNAAFDGTCGKRRWPAWVMRRAAYLADGWP